MGEVIAVISGKGGTGKTSVCAGIASCLAVENKRVLCIDADIGLRNLDIALGMSDLSVIAFSEVLQGSYTLQEATEHPSIPGLHLLTAPVRMGDASVDEDKFAQLLQQAREEFDFCLIDAPAGLGSGFRLATKFADRYLVVSTSDPASMRDASSTAECLLLEEREQLQLVVNRVQPKIFSRMSLTVDDMMDSLGLPLLGLVPEDDSVVLAAATNKPLILYSSKGAAEAYRRISRRLRHIPMPLMKL